MSSLEPMRPCFIPFHGNSNLAPKLAGLVLSLLMSRSAPAAPWLTNGPLSLGRNSHTATLLLNGQVLIAGGIGNPGFLINCNLYDPSTGTTRLAGSIITTRRDHTATLLLDGQVLVAGGQSTNFVTLSSTELYNVGLGFSANWQPHIATATSPLPLGRSLALAGSGFRGVTEGSGGNGTQSSASACPVVQLRNLESGQTAFLSSTNWQAGSFASLPLANVPPGHALATVFVNGIPSDSRILNLTAAPVSFSLTNPTRLQDGSFQFEFTNSPGVAFEVLAASTAAFVPNELQDMGAAREIASGVYRFVDTGSTNECGRFYRVRSP
jgi:hypothetical protein